MQRFKLRPIKAQYLRDNLLAIIKRDGKQRTVSFHFVQYILLYYPPYCHHRAGIRSSGNRDPHTFVDRVHDHAAADIDGYVAVIADQIPRLRLSQSNLSAVASHDARVMSPW